MTAEHHTKYAVLLSTRPVCSTGHGPGEPVLVPLRVPVGLISAHKPPTNAFLFPLPSAHAASYFQGPSWPASILESKSISKLVLQAS